MGLNAASFWPLVPAQPQTETFANDQGAVSYFSSELMLSGWCPHLVDRLQTNEMCFQYMCMFLEPPHADKDHSRCTPKKCVAFHIEKSTYSHQHVTEDCECDMIRVDTEVVCSILDDGGIPVVEVSASETDGIVRSTPQHLTVKDTKQISHRYVAISHVWSDGLGNPMENSIASCQLRRISQVVSQLPGSGGGPVRVWIDTLCCPVQPKKMRHLAIIRMRQTYQGASSVLVLDKSLQKLSHRGMGLMELVAHIFSSAWMTRLWTWQEGALPNECYIQFFDGAFNFEDLLDRAMEARQSVHDLSYFTLREVAMLYWGVRGRPNTRGPSATARFELSQITSALEGRSTSMIEDEATCIGAMMNCDLSKILAFDGARDRMRAFWQTCPSIPREVLFWNLTRLPDPGFRWAPDTFLNVGGGSQLDRADVEHTVVLKPAGLQAQLPGFLLQGGLDHPVNTDFWISDSSGHWSWHVMGNPEMPGGVFGNPTVDDVAPHYTQLALLVDRKVDAASARRSTPVTLVYVYAQEDGVVYARRSDTAFMFWEDHPAAQRRPVMDRLKRTLNDPENPAVERRGMNVLLSGRYHVLEGHWVGADQQWCID